MRISDWSSDVCSSDLALYTVEEQLNEACGPLQEAGRRTIEGEELGSLLQFAVFNAMEICAAKSEEVAYYVRLARSYSSPAVAAPKTRSEEHTSELQSLMRISYAVFCLKKKKK